ncbi:hypothetical protein [Enterococcus alishanensis]
MANRRMFSKDVVDSDRFLDMPPTTQNLYFHLGIQADDDGFVSSPKKVKRACSATDDDLKLLEAKEFIISFESGVIVIKDWKLNNYIQKDRYTPTVFLKEKNHILTTENRSYAYLDTERIHNVSNLDTQYSIEQDSIGQFSLGKDRKAKESKEQGSKGQSSLEVSHNQNSTSVQDCIEYYESYYGETGQFDKKTLMNLASIYGIEFLYEAIDKTAIREDVKSPLGYTTQLLKEWKKKDFTTIADIENEQEEFNKAYEE